MAKAVSLAVVAALAFSGTAVAAYVAEMNANIKTYDVKPLVKVKKPTRAPESTVKSPGDPFAGRAINVLFIGVDTRYGDNAQFSNDGDLNDSELNDVNMLVHISADRTRVDVVNIPRDLLTDVGPCEQPDGGSSGVYHGTDYGENQINAAWGIGTGWNKEPEQQPYGVACVVSTIQDLSGLNIDAWALVEFASFAAIVNSLNGVDLCLPEPFKSNTSPRIDLPAGYNHLNGYQALRYARIRKGVGLDGSDSGRIVRQQQLVASVINRILSQGSLSDLSTLNAFAMTATSSLTMSPEIGSIEAMAGLGWALRDIDTANVSFIPMPSVTSPRNSNRVEVDEGGWSNSMGLTTAEVFELLATDQPLPGTVPYKILHPEEAQPGQTDDGGAGQSDEGTDSGEGGLVAQPQTNPDQVMPNKDVTTAETSPVICR